MVWRTMALAAAVALSFAASAQSQIWNEDFEDDGAGVRYTLSTLDGAQFSDGSSDFFCQIPSAAVTGSYVLSGQNNTGYFAGQDTDGEATGGAVLSITFEDINIAGATGLELRMLAAEDDDGSNEDWDASDLVYVEVDFDNSGTFTKVLQFANDGTSFNAAPYHDTDLDGIGDGAEITPTFAQFTALLGSTGSALDIRVTFENITAAQEDFALDFIEVWGVTGGGTPGCTDDTATNYDPAATVDDGSCTYDNACNLPGTVVQAGSFFYSPQDLVIATGETVVWENVGGTHNVDGTTDVIGAGTYTNPENFFLATVTASGADVCIGEYTFTVPGVYNYNCSIGAHAASGMVGTITVGVGGCTDATADNYDASAEYDDGSCVFTPGCTDANSVDYDPLATSDDGSCTYNNGTACTLFFSEYAEGSSNNKYLEIYNPTALTVSLDGWAYPNISNAPTTVGVFEFWNTFAPGASIAPGEVYIIAHGSADPLILAEADETNNFLSNGDDAFGLAFGTESDYVLVDIIGSTSGDPGSGWDVAGVANATQNYTLRRKDTVNNGNGGNWIASAGTDATDSEWIVEGIDVWIDLGLHTYTAGACETVNGCTNPAASNFNYLATDDDGTCIIEGCTDSTAINYDPAATVDDGTCIFAAIELIINEIHYNGNDGAGFPDTDWEFIEIYNNGATAVDLNGFVLQDDDGVFYTFGTGDQIAAGEYIVAALNAATFAGGGYQVFEWVGGSLTNGGDGPIQLLDNLTNVVDEVTYDDATPWDVAADGFGPSLELINETLDNSLAESWCATGGPDNGTPGAINSCYTLDTDGCTNPAADNFDPGAITDDGSCLIGGCTDPAALNFDPEATYDDGTCVFMVDDIVINEIHYNPCGDQGDDTVYEFIELYNNSGASVDLTGWTLSNALDHTFGAVTMADGEYIVVVVDATADVWAGVSYQVIQWTSGGINNTGETITLSNDLGIVVDEVTYADSSPWPISADGFCSSLELIDFTTDNADAANWQASYVDNGTPGAANSIAPPSTSYTIVECQTVATEGEQVATNGVVTAVYTNEYVIQDGTGPYSAIWVIGTGVSQGDELDVFGELVEFFGRTQIQNTLAVLQSTANPLPAAEVLTTGAMGDEQWESVLCEATGQVAQADAGFGNWTIDDGTGQIGVYDLGYDAIGDLTLTLVEGDTYRVVGPNAYDFGQFKFAPRDAADVTKLGCTDNLFANFDPEAEEDDGSCSNTPGCTDPAADNYDATAGIDDGSCIYTGCDDVTALNYDAQVNNADNSTCYYTLPEIVITEIQYNPCGVSADDYVYEFVEIYNNGATDADLSGYTFAQGFVFTFPAGSILPAGAYGIVTVDATTYTGDCTNLWEVEWGNLSNSGATIEITDAFGNQVDIVAYDDAAPWPVEADGDCPTLELNDPNLDNNDGNNWHASTVDYGTPCEGPIEGCTDATAFNYDETAYIDDGSCVYEGCTNPAATNYDPIATIDDGSCIVPGCTYAEADNYNMEATDDDGSCTFDNVVNDCQADLDGDGTIGTTDLLALLAVFGSDCP